MKFGKRLLSEAERRWMAYYVDYKALKRAIQSDIVRQGEDCVLYEFLIRD